MVFPELRFFAGFFRRLLSYIIQCISISIIKHISFQYVSLQYGLFQYVPIQNPFNTYPFNTYRFNTYPVNDTRIHSIRLHQEWQWMSIQNLSLHIIASARMAMSVKSLHVISYHCYSAGMAMKTKPCISFNFIAPLHNGISLYRERMNMQFIASYWPALHDSDFWLAPSIGM